MRRVIFLYKYDGRKHQVVRKKLEVASAKSKRKDSTMESSIEDVLSAESANVEKYLQ